jgi:hypothetical protein
MSFYECYKNQYVYSWLYTLQVYECRRGECSFALNVENHVFFANKHTHTHTHIYIYVCVCVCVCVCSLFVTVEANISSSEHIQDILIHKCG